MARILGRPRFFRFPWRNREEIGNDVDDELRFHLEMRTLELSDAGMEPEEARREAMRRFGNLKLAHKTLKSLGAAGEQKRRRTNMLNEFWQDIRYAVRSLAQNPGFLLVTVLVLALGIGVNAAMFGLINMLLLKPMLIEEPDRLVGIYSEDTEKPATFRAFSYPSYVDIREQNRVFSELAAHSITTVGLSDGEVTKRVMSALVSSNYFKTFGVPMAHGRGFLPAEERPGSAIPAVVVSHQFWTRRGDPDLLGKTLRLNGQSVEVVGIAAEGFTGSTAMFSPDLWLPLGLYGSLTTGFASSLAARLDDRENYSWMLLGRLEDGVTQEAALPQLQSLAARLEAQYPDTNQNQTLTMAPLPRLGISTEPARDSFLAVPAVLVMAMTGVVLLIACLNLANMFLARGASRSTELAIRVSLGGGRGRLLRQLLTEGLVLSLIGGAVGLAFSFWASKLLFSSLSGLVPLGVSFVLDFTPDARVLAATFVLSLLATFFFGFGPAWKVTGGQLLSNLKEGAEPGVARRAGRARWSPSSLLVVAQIALSLVLLTAGGLFLRGAAEAGQATPGFSLEHSLLVELDPSLIGYDETQGRDLYRRVMERLRGIPQVEAAGLASIVPFGSVTSTKSVRPAGAGDDYEAISAHNYAVGDDYFESLRLPILRGRGFTAGEAVSAEGLRVAVIDEPLARRLWPDEEALGRQLELVTNAPGALPEPIEIVGVVPGTRHQFWDQAPSPHLYRPFGQQYFANMHVHIRVSDLGASEASMLQTVREELRMLDPALPVLTLKTMIDHRDQSLFLWLVRAGAKVFTILGALALLLALVGVYGVKAFLVARRTREIGIRLALGATPREVLTLMVREGAVLTLTGLAIGLVLALGTGQLLRGLLYQVSAVDPLVIVTAVILLAATATLATYLPARRATRVAPTTALRYE